MSSAIASLIVLLDKLPASTQENVLDHVRVYLEDLEWEQRWETMFLRLQDTLTLANQVK